MLIGSNRKLANVSSLSLSIFDCDLDSVNKFKYLGIMLASDFTWSDHVEYVISKVNQRLGLLHRIKHLLPFTARLLFYNSLVLPRFDYGDLVWADKNNVTGSYQRPTGFAEQGRKNYSRQATLFVSY